MVSPDTGEKHAVGASSRLPRVAIVVLNWNGLVDTLACLQSLSSITYREHRVLVVDNGSSDGSSDTIRADFPKIEVKELEDNLGFAEGNNVGIRCVMDSDYVLLLNNDTTVAPDLIEILVESMEADNRIGVAGPAICYSDSPETLWCAGLQIGSGSAYGIKLHRTSSILMYTGRHTSELPTGTFDVDAVVGCAMFMRTSLIREIGLLDASLFMIHEDFDWSLRARAAGYRCVTVAYPGVWHKVSSSMQVHENMDAGNPVSQYYWYRNWLVIIGKHFGRGVKLSVAAMYLFSLFPKLLVRQIRTGELSRRVLAAYYFALKDSLLGPLSSRFLK